MRGKIMGSISSAFNTFVPSVIQQAISQIPAPTTPAPSYYNPYTPSSSYGYVSQPYYSPFYSQPNYIYGQQPMDMSYTGIMGNSYYSNPAAAQPYTPVNYGKLGSYPMAPSQFQPYIPPRLSVQEFGVSGGRPGEIYGPSAILPPITNQSQSLQEMANAPVARPGVEDPQFTTEQLVANAPVTPSAAPAPVAPPPAPVVDTRAEDIQKIRNEMSILQSRIVDADNNDSSDPAAEARYEELQRQLLSM